MQNSSYNGISKINPNKGEDQFNNNLKLNTVVNVSFKIINQNY